MGEVQVGPRFKLPTAFSVKDVRTSQATILVYAQPRFGKTNLIRSLPEQGFKPIILATELGDSMGLKTISDLDVPAVPITTWDESLAVFAELGRIKGKVTYPYAGASYEADVVVNDSLSGWGGIWMERGLEALNWEEVGVAQKGHDPRQIYAYIPEKGRQTTKALMNLSAHLILICRETQVDEGEGAQRITYLAPELPGAKLPRELPGWLDAVVFGKVVQGQRVFMTEPEGKQIAGIREAPGRRFPKYIKADYGLLIKAMMGDQDAMKALHVDLKQTGPAAPVASSTNRK